MDSTDKNIKKAFSTYTKNFDVDLEDAIMDKLIVEKNYSVELAQSRKRLKIGMILSTLLLILFFILTYFDTLPKMNNQMKILEVYFPSIFTAMLVLIMYFLFTFSYTSPKNGIDNLFIPEK